MPERRETSPKSTYVHSEKRLFCLRLTDSFGLESHWHKVNMHERKGLRKGFVSAEKDKIPVSSPKKRAKYDRKYEFLAASPFSLAQKLLLCWDGEAPEDLWQPESSSDLIAGWAV